MMSLGSKIEFSLFGMADDGGNDADIPTVTAEIIPRGEGSKKSPEYIRIIRELPAFGHHLGIAGYGKTVRPVVIRGLGWRQTLSTGEIHLGHDLRYGGCRLGGGCG